MLLSAVVAAVVAVLLAGHGWVALLGAAAAGLVTLIVETALFPNAPCWWCRGKPRRYGIGEVWRDCLVCGGSGRRRRILAKGGGRR